MLVLFLAAAFASSFFTGRMKRNVPFSFATVAVATIIYKVAGYLLSVLWFSLVQHTVTAMDLADFALGSLLPQLGLNLIAAIPLVFLLKFLGPYKRGSAKDKNEDKIISGEGNWVTY